MGSMGEVRDSIWGQWGTVYGIYEETEPVYRISGEIEARHIGSMGELRDCIWDQWGN